MIATLFASMQIACFHVSLLCSDVRRKRLIAVTKPRLLVFAVANNVHDPAECAILHSDKKFITFT